VQRRFRPIARTRCCRGRRSRTSPPRQLDELVVTNTIPLRRTPRLCSKIRQLSIGELLAETMRRVSNEESVSSLFVD
jgi:phosphoribosylpyrophosphate synthetase